MSRDLSAYIESLTDYEKTPGALTAGFETRFRKFRAFVRRRSDPWRSFPCVHIAGSKGKGSVAHGLARLLTPAFRTVGLFTSPHLLDVTERIRINGHPLPKSRFRGYADRVRRIAEKDGIRLSYFEFLTFMSFLVFRDEKVGAAVYETGLGGRLDATNVVDPAACVITAIEREHEDILGPGLGRVAAEKFGILKPGRPVFSLGQAAPVRAALRAKARELGCRLFEESLAFESRVLSVGPDGCSFEYRDVLPGQPVVLRTAMPAPHQARNVALALFISRWVFSCPVNPRLVAEIEVPGRFETIRRSPVVIFDPCHTPASFRGLIDTLGRLYPLRRIVLYLSLFADKDLAGIARIVAGSGIPRTVWIENPHPRSVPFCRAVTFFPRLGSMRMDLPFEPEKLSREKIHVFCGSFSVYRFIKIS